MVTAAPDQLDLSALAQVLFASPVQPSELPSPEATRTAIEVQYHACHQSLAECVGIVAQEAGDRPDLYMARMRWARRSVAVAYSDRLVDVDGALTLPPLFMAPLEIRAPLLACAAR